MPSFQKLWAHTKIVNAIQECFQCLTTEQELASKNSPCMGKIERMSERSGEICDRWAWKTVPGDLEQPNQHPQSQCSLKSKLSQGLRCVLCAELAKRALINPYRQWVHSLLLTEKLFLSLNVRFRCCVFVFLSVRSQVWKFALCFGTKTWNTEQSQIKCLRHTGYY